MKKVINSKVYNTKTAIKVAEYDNGLPYTDFNNFSETLYKTKNGNWFIHGEGGANTSYSERQGNMSYGSSDIRAIDDHEAYQFLEEHNCIDAIKEHFPHEIEEA